MSSPRTGAAGVHLAVDLGGTACKAALLGPGPSFDVLARADERTSGLSGDQARGLLARVGADLVGRTDNSVHAIGLSVPGIVAHGRVVALPGKFDGIVGADLHADLQDLAPGAGVAVVNDAVAFGLGAAATEGADDRVLAVTLGTGVGVAVIEQGRPATAGAWGAGILGGFLPIGIDTDVAATDTAGGTGTVEAALRTPTLLARAAAAGASPGDLADGRALSRARDRGDPAAVRAFTEHRHALAHGLAVLATAHTPDRIVIGGGITTPSEDEAVPFLLDGIEQLLHPLLWPGQTPTVTHARRGADTALIGVAALASASSP